MVKELDTSEPIERLEKREMRRIRPLVNLRNIVYGLDEEKEDKKEADNLVKLKFDELSSPIKKHATQEAKKTGKDLNEIINSEPFKKYLLKRLK